MKLFFLTPDIDGGGGRVLSDLSVNLPSYIKKTIISFSNRINYQYDGSLIVLNLKPSKNIFAKMIIFLKAFVKARKIILQEKPDFVISFGNLQNIINVLTNKNAVLRIDNPILESHRKLLTKIYPILVKIFFNRAKMIIVVSDGLKLELIEKFGIKENKIKIIYNAIDINKIKQLSLEPIESQYKNIFENPVVINIGSIIGQKGQWHLIKAFKKIKNSIKNAKLVILGEGELRYRLEKLAKEIGLEDDIYFLGRQKNPFKFLAKSKVFALSSLWEGFGMVILESMACRVPVVSSDCPTGPKIILEDFEFSKYGILVSDMGQDLTINANTPLTVPEQELSSSIVKLLSDENLHKNISEEALKRVCDFSMEENIKKWKNILL